MNYFCQLILLFSLFLLLFMGLTALFGTIYRFHYTILANFSIVLLAKSFQFQQNKWIPMCGFDKTKRQRREQE